MKSLFNRRGAVLAGASAHLLDLEHGALLRSPSTCPAALAPARGAAPLPPEPQHDAQRTPDPSGPRIDDAPDPHEALVAPPERTSAPQETMPPLTTLRAVAAMPAQGGARGTVTTADTAEVDDLCAQEALAPFRVFRSFAYSASLLFHARDLGYYIALYHDNTLWRALKAADTESAEAAFHHFQELATRLADTEARRLQLEAQNEQVARLIVSSESRAERLRMHLQRVSMQEQAVSARQHQLRKEVAQLEAQRVAMQAHLNKVQRQLHQLNLVNNENLPHLPSGR